jgi:sterol desaturase/sphingolipid hydroxylase (fatty acid hydroxylase superfamily)
MILVICVSFVSGALSWWALEYVLHRWVGHSKRSRTEFAKEHRRHHALGDYFAPTTKKILYTTPVMAVVGIALSLGLGVARGAAFTVGLAAMYTAYEFFHRRLHTHAPSGRFGRWARRHHFHHHFVNPAANHGVTTPIFDKVFRTEEIPQQIPVPAKLAMVWLIDPDTDDVRPEYAADYRIMPTAR